MGLSIRTNQWRFTRWEKFDVVVGAARKLQRLWHLCTMPPAPPACQKQCSLFASAAFVCYHMILLIVGPDGTV